MPRVSKAKTKTKTAAKNQPVWRQQLDNWYRGQIARWRRPLKIAALCVPIFGVIAGGAYWAVASGWVARTQNATVHTVLNWTAGLGFAVADVRVVGRSEVPKDTILAILNVRPGDPILGFDPDEARSQLERLSWVGAVTVRRQLPDLIQIKLVERTPAALWQRDGEISLIDADGHILDTADVRDYRHLPLLAGQGAATRTRELFAILADAPLIAEQMVAAAWIADRRWDLTLESEVILRLPENQPAAALDRLLRVHNDHDLLNQDILTIDLRVDDRLVVETPSPDVAELIDPQQSL
ncbi:MAG: cell division protein FtsQ/DivIB [Pseudomonadota bacterium]